MFDQIALVNFQILLKILRMKLEIHPNTLLTIPQIEPRTEENVPLTAPNEPDTTDLINPSPSLNTPKILPTNQSCTKFQTNCNAPKNICFTPSHIFLKSPVNNPMNTFTIPMITFRAPLITPLMAFQVETIIYLTKAQPTFIIPVITGMKNFTVATIAPNTALNVVPIAEKIGLTILHITMNPVLILFSACMN